MSPYQHDEVQGDIRSNDSNEFIRERSRTPSINSQSYAIPTDSITIDSNDIDESTANESDSSDSNSTGFSCQSDNNNTQLSSNSNRMISNISSSRTEDLEHEVRVTGNGLLRHLSSTDTSMFDVSNFLFKSLEQTIEGVDFSECLQLQSKTSGLLNSKIEELTSLNQQLIAKFSSLQTKFKETDIRCSNSKKNLKNASHMVNRIKLKIARRYPIEYNQARYIINNNNSKDDDEIYNP
ncbi:uncharacterized protein SCODWIG_01953 [Saccharomycodes ludwigii]|uniref:Biogenesis of lysosome-related organelles complex 1 subunit KXD1 n=1 Tax=Saccharomycodes ludwigii TaxID=36035 RepID=A0A376B6B8_9ASCO|nr:hypothetical protein SCDLUD_001089 [Saccharomycodes ludwigii]KAH3903449.1 hypothetical protein SCDLUD_001089 [Saccharomycodes ludwigii]SSD60192.1 uncharacterized protein SCODWIG_01953 [Saccharomycodes ludwigii]